LAIIKVGNFEDVGVKPKALAGGSSLRLPRSMSLAASRQLSDEIEVKGMDLVRSKEPWALYLKRLTLHRGFEGFLSAVFNRTNEIYFVAFAWDYSGRKPKVFPYTTLEPAEYVLKMRKGQTRDFVGDGVALWPARRVSGALNVIIMVYESDREIQRSGEVIESIHTAVDKSTLTNLVTAIAANPAIATARAISAAVKDLIDSVGKIMKKNKNDVVELFEGSYGTHLAQASRREQYHTDAAGVELDLTVGSDPSRDFAH
jgi:hypothetical protein